MITLIAFIDQVAIGIYFLLAAAILLALRRYVIYGEEYRSSYFELERDLSRYRRSNAITLVIFLLQIALIVAGVQIVVVPEPAARTGAGRHRIGGAPGRRSLPDAGASHALAQYRHRSCRPAAIG